MSVLYAKGFNAYHFIKIVKRAKDSIINTNQEKVKFLTYGSLVLRYIYHQIAISILQLSRLLNKLLLCKDIPFSAQFRELTLNIVYIETSVLYTKLSNQERIELVKRFNNKEILLMILIIMYSMLAQGVNLDYCCNRIIIVTNISNAT